MVSSSATPRSSHELSPQDNVLVDQSGRARLNNFGFSAIATLDCAEVSEPKFRGSSRWMAPELHDQGNFSFRTRDSDIFALGMITIEVRNTYHGRLPYGFETLSCTSLQLFTGQVPFPEDRASANVIKRIIDGERPPRPSEGKELGLSDELWEFVRSSWIHEAEGRPPVSAFIGLLEKATPDIVVLEQLSEFDADSEEHIQGICRMFEYGDNTLLGMREEETLVVIEVFDRASPCSKPLHAPRTFLTSSGFRFSIPRWMTPHSTAGVYTGFRKFPPGLAFCPRAAGSPSPTSPNPMVVSPP